MKSYFNAYQLQVIRHLVPSSETSHTALAYVALLKMMSPFEMLYCVNRLYDIAGCLRDLSQLKYLLGSQLQPFPLSDPVTTTVLFDSTLTESVYSKVDLECVA